MESLVKMTLGFRGFRALTLTMRLNRSFHSLVWPITRSLARR